MKNENGCNLVILMVIPLYFHLNADNFMVAKGECQIRNKKLKALLQYYNGLPDSLLWVFFCIWEVNFVRRKWLRKEGEKKSAIGLYTHSELLWGKVYSMWQPSIVLTKMFHCWLNHLQI